MEPPLSTAEWPGREKGTVVLEVNETGYSLEQHHPVELQWSTDQLWATNASPMRRQDS